MKPKNKNLLDLMSDKDKAKVKARQDRLDARRDNFITSEWLSLSELGVYFGWEAIMAVFNDVITIPQMNTLIRGARNIHSGHVYDQAVASRAGNCTQEGFEILTKKYRDDMNEVN